MAQYEITPEELTVLSHRYKVTAAEIEATLRALTLQTARLRNDWIGSASTSFQATAHDVGAAGNELCTALARMADLLASASQAYTSEEQNVRNAFG